MNKPALFLSAFVLSTLIDSQFAPAAIFNVNDGDSSGLAVVINNANANNQDDTINLAPNGHYTVDSNATLTAFPALAYDNSHTTTINGQGATITVNHINYQESRIFDVVGTAILTNLVLDHGFTPYSGAAVHNGGNVLTISNCTFTNNSADNNFGFGVVSNDAGGNLYVQSCTFQNNYTNVGMVYNTAFVSVTNCVFDGNFYGGALYNSSNAIVTGCTFTNNNFRNGGGAISNHLGTVNASSCTFDDNHPDQFGNGTTYGGAIENVGGAVSLANCTFYSNFSSNGGAIHSAPEINSGPAASLVIYACTFVDNGDPQIDLDATYGGSSLQIGNTLFAADQSASLGVRGSPAITSLGYNLANDTALGHFNAMGDQINTDALVDPTGLQNNGGARKSIALTAGSPAIDKGKSFGLPTDGVGQSRPYDVAGYFNASDASDIGAFEVRDPVQGGTSLVVTTTADHDDLSCGSDCSLREAVNHANNDPVFNTYTITFANGVTGTITPANELVLHRSVTINGPGARSLAISGNSAHRVFSSSETLTLSGLTIRDGRVTAAPGEAAQGGGILTTFHFTAQDCMFSGNQVTGGSGNGGQGSAGVSGQGGALYVGPFGTATLTGCTFSSNNSAKGGAGIFSGGGQGGAGGAGQGGDIFNAGHLTLTNCTVAGGTAIGGNGGGSSSFGGPGGAANGGGICNTQTLTMTACTVSGNAGTGGTGGSGNFKGSAGSGSGGIANLSGTATLTDNLVANNNRTNNAGADVDGAFTSGGYNLISTADHSTGFGATGDKTGTDAAPINSGLLSGVGDSGGPTDTFVMLPNSPAIDASSNTVAPHRDQRGYLRTGTSDIGAFEYAGSLLNLIAVSRSGSDLVLSLEVVKGKTYSLERKLNMTDSWQSIPTTPDKTATGNDIETLIDFSAVSAYRHAFYHGIFAY